MGSLRSLTALLLLSLSAMAAEPPRRVLIIHSFGRDFAPFHELAGEFRAQLARHSASALEFLEVSVEMVGLDGEPRDQPLVDFLSAVFAKSDPSLLVPIGGPAALFCLRHREALFPEVPLLVVGVDERRLAGQNLGPNGIAIPLKIETLALLANILDLLPETRRVYVVMGSAPLERFWEAELRRDWSNAPAGVTFHWLSHQALPQLRETAAHLPPQSAILVGILNRDAAGIPHEQEEGLLALHQAANAPIFGYGSHQLGLGIVGGRLLPLQRAGQVAAEVGRRLLAGEPATSFRIEPVEMDPPTYDARELRRWGIPESALPTGAAVLFQSPSLWQSHRQAVLAALGIALLQSGLIVLLLAARRRARDAAASLSLAAEAANVGVWQRDLDTDEIKATAQWREMIGLPASGRLTLGHLLRLAHPDDAPRLDEVLSQAARNGGRYEVEFRVVQPDGRVRWILSLGRAEPASGPQRRQTRGVSLDITARRQMEAEVSRQRGELTHLSRVASLGVLSGSLAHEMSQPLGIILANAQAAQRLLNRPSPDLSELREILADIVSEDHRASEVIQRLRALLRRGESRPQDFAVHECCDEVLRLVRGDLTSRGVTVHREFAAGAPRVRADRVQLQQVLLNLISNACDAMEDNPVGDRPLTLVTTCEASLLHLTVRDRGSGLPSDTRELFQPFHTTKPRGLGLGLAICRMILDAHQGRLWAEANADRGAAFHLTLPLAP